MVPHKEKSEGGWFCRGCGCSAGKGEDAQGAVVLVDTGRASSRRVAHRLLGVGDGGHGRGDGPWVAEDVAKLDPVGVCGVVTGCGELGLGDQSGAQATGLTQNLTSLRARIKEFPQRKNSAGNHKNGPNGMRIWPAVNPVRGQVMK
jgi:hypothetical protein